MASHCPIGQAWILPLQGHLLYPKQHRPASENIKQKSYSKKIIGLTVPFTKGISINDFCDDVIGHLEKHGLDTISYLLDIAVENNGCLAVKPKTIKLTYAETVRIESAVNAQNRLIGNGRDPTNEQNKVDIKTK